MEAGLETMRRLFEAFAARDAEGMADCYAPDATFRDPVFELSGSEVPDMWRMLVSRGGDLRVKYRLLDDASATWTARYTFRGRPVRNEVHSSFAFDDDGRILRQVDTFDFPSWARQALGLKGRFFGRSRFLRSAVRRKSARSLAAWRARHARDPT